MLDPTSTKTDDGCQEFELKSSNTDLQVFSNECYIRQPRQQQQQQRQYYALIHSKMQLLMFVNEYADQGEAGFYIVINGDKLKNYFKKQQHQQMNINNDTSGQKKLDGYDDTTDQVEWFNQDNMAWLDYHKRVGTRHVKSYIIIISNISLQTIVKGNQTMMTIVIAIIERRKEEEEK